MCVFHLLLHHSSSSPSASTAARMWNWSARSADRSRIQSRRTAVDLYIYQMFSLMSSVKCNFRPGVIPNNNIRLLTKHKVVSGG